MTKTTVAVLVPLPPSGEKSPDKIDYDSNVLFHPEPRLCEYGSRKWYHWFSLCGRYRLSRLVSNIPEEVGTHQYTWCYRYGPGKDDWNNSEKTLTGRIPYYATMEEAFDSVLERHYKTVQKIGVKTNKETLLKELEEQQHITLTKPKVKQPKVLPNGEPRKPRISSTGTDRFGFRNGSQCSQLNSQITAEGKTLQQIQAGAGIIYPSIKNHMKKLIDKGFVVMIGNKYKLA